MNFKDKPLEAFWDNPDENLPRHVPPELRRATYRKLQILDAAKTLQDLRVPPSNHLEKLNGDRSGQHSVRVNKRWRICFVWTEDGAKEVEFCDYH